MSRKFRSMSSFVVLATALALMGLTAPGAQAEVGDLQVEIVNQPADAGVGDLITAEAFDPTGGESGFVQVHVTHTVEVCDPETETCQEEDQDLQFAEVTFVLPEGSPSTDLHVVSRFTNADGNATFEPECDEESDVCDNPLWIGTANAPFTTEYRLIPVATPPPPEIELTSLTAESTQGEESGPFDIWQDGCHGVGCNVNIRNLNETYTAGADVGLGASVVPFGSGEISCVGQRIIFANSLFFHATTGDGTDTVLLVEHITRDDMKASTNNGQKHIGWCIGLKSAAPWIHNGASYTTQVVGGQTLFVAMAPKCPNKRRAVEFAPCIVSQMGDGFGGSFIRGYVTGGGDPPRRT
jgi:hypothetical protein